MHSVDNHSQVAPMPMPLRSGPADPVPVTPTSTRLALELCILDGAREARRQSLALPACADARDGGALVLVVASDDDVRSYLHEHLRSQGMRVNDARSVSQALESVRTELPRVIVVNAPEVALLSLVPNATVVVLGDALPQRAVDAPAEWVLMPWPLDVQQLVNEVARLVD